MFSERLSELPVSISDYRAHPGVRARTRWQALPSHLKSSIVQSAEAAKNRAWSVLPAHLYLQFSRSGNRTNYEDAYFLRRNTLCDLILGECVEYQGQYLDSIIDGIFLVCEESGWHLPAHNTYKRDHPALPLPVGNRPIIDLFAGETAAMLSILRQLLEAPLNSVDPEVTARIDRELQQRIITPYLTQHYWWMGNGRERLNNWTAWCTQNVLLTALTHPVDQPQRLAVIHKAAVSLDDFLKDYGDDGACVEGPYYYRHAGLCLLQCLEILTTVAPRAFKPLWREKKIRNLAEFIVSTHIRDDRYHNFSDCPASFATNGVQEFLAGQRAESALLKNFAQARWQANGCQPSTGDGLFQRLQALFSARAIQNHQPESRPKPDRFFPSIGLLTASDSTFDLAVKAGRNDNSGHNHNDVGNVILYKHGQPLLIDIGNESYTSKTFSDRRYEIWTMQSAYHNLPTINGVMQQDGEEFAATDVSVELGEKLAMMSMDIVSAYPAQTNTQYYRRTVRLHKNNHVEIEDVTDTQHPVVLTLMLALPPQVVGNRLQVGRLAVIQVEGAETIDVEAIDITDPLLVNSWPEGRLYRVLIRLSEPRLILNIR